MRRKLKKFRKKTLLELVEFKKNGDVLVQNEGEEWDRWVIDKDVFNKTYEEVE